MVQKKLTKKTEMLCHRTALNKSNIYRIKLQFQFANRPKSNTFALLLLRLEVGIKLRLEIRPDFPRPFPDDAL